MDLTDPLQREKHRDSRFISKVFTEREQKQITTADRPDLVLWSLWAAKETAYKALNKTHSHISALPRYYTVRLQCGESDDRMTGIVETPRDPVCFTVFIYESFVHCVGICGQNELPASVTHRVGTYHEITDDDRSRARDAAVSKRMRTLLREEIAALLGYTTEEIAIVRRTGPTGLGPPIVVINKKKSTVDISLSHDGNFFAYAFLCHDTPSGVSANRPSGLKDHPLIRHAEGHASTP